MSTSVQPYNITLNEQSPTFQYSPFRNGDITKGWNETFTGGPVYVPGSSTTTPSIRATQYNGAQMTFTFEGTALYLCYTNHGSTTSLTLDGSPVTTTAPVSDDACSIYNGLAQTLAVADGLAYMEHTAVLDVTISEAEGIFWFFGGVVSISIGEPGSTVSETQWIDDRDPLWQWSPWSPWPQSSYYLEYNDTASYACNYGSNVYGTYLVPPGASAIQLLGMPLSNSYLYTIAFDNVETMYNAESTLAIGQTVLFFAGGLDPTVAHTISAINFNANVPNPPANLPGTSQCFPNLDALLVMKVSPPAALPQSSSSSSTSASPSTSSTTASSTSPSAYPSSTTALATSPSASPSSTTALSTSPSASPSSTTASSTSPSAYPSSTTALSTSPSAYPSSTTALSTSPSISLSSTTASSTYPSAYPASTTASSTSPSASLSSTAASSSGSTSVGAIAGGVVGGLVVLMILSLSAYVFLRRRRSRRRSLMPTPDAALDGEDQEVDQSSVYQSPSSTSRSERMKGPRLPVSPLATSHSISGIDTPRHDLEHVSTVQMVEVLNNRLRLEQADNVEEPPSY